MTDQSKPALSAEAWQQQIDGTAYIKRGGWTEIGLGVYATISSDPSIPERNDTLNPDYGCRPPYLILHWHTVADAMAIHEPHRLAALCLYQQPFGFTHEDVKLLEMEAASVRSVRFEAEGADGDHDAAQLANAFYQSHADSLRSLASRISSLLPPET